MKRSAKLKTTLICNPLTGSSALAKALKLTESKEDEIPEGDKVLLVVRHPNHRFLAACTLAIHSLDADLTSAGADDEFIESVNLLRSRNVAGQNLTVAFLSLFESRGSFEGAPIYFQPQRNWYTRRVDLVIPQHRLGSFVTAEHPTRSIRYDRSTKHWQTRATKIAHLESALRVLYRGDFELLQVLSVWEHSHAVHNVFGKVPVSAARDMSERLDALIPTEVVAAPVEEEKAPVVVAEDAEEEGQEVSTPTTENRPRKRVSRKKGSRKRRGPRS